MQPPKPATPEPTSLSLEIWVDSELERASYYDVEVKLQTVIMTLLALWYFSPSLAQMKLGSKSSWAACQRQKEGPRKRGKPSVPPWQRHDTRRGDLKASRTSSSREEHWHCFSTLWRHACSITLWDLLLLMPMNQNVRNLLDSRWFIINSWITIRKMENTGATFWGLNEI